MLLFLSNVLMYLYPQNLSRAKWPIPFHFKLKGPPRIYFFKYSILGCQIRSQPRQSTTKLMLLSARGGPGGELPDHVGQGHFCL